MDIKESVEKWFAETYQEILDKISTEHPVDRFILSVLQASRKYISAALLLVKNGHKMPTKALLRILCELLIKFEWCIGVYDAQQDNARERSVSRIMRWEKSTLQQRIKELSKWESLSNDPLRRQAMEQKAGLEKILREEENNKVIPLPRTFVDFIKQELPEGIRDDVYPHFYVRYNDAVHIDIACLRFLVREKTDRVEIWEDTPDETLDLLECIALHATLVNGLIREYYGWDAKVVGTEHDALLKTLRNGSSPG